MPVQKAAFNARAPPRGLWGDDGYDVYGDGQHRGSPSAGGRHGYAWQSDGTVERPFYGPPGGFVEGALGPDFRQRGWIPWLSGWPLSVSKPADLG